MPTYDYQCEQNGEIVEVRHAMNDTISTWGELCEKKGIPPGTTPLDSPVKKLATGGQVVKSSSLKENLPPCATGGGCSGGACGFN
ncbi:MAG: zinc ribbon domain-containing protein [Gammaproteobacteria bacterium]|nr:zinc ribbon domain-containing protein [Gammaproteobacteria bacterium]